MTNYWLNYALTLGMGFFALTLQACSPTIEAPAPPPDEAATTTATPPSAPATATPPTAVPTASTPPVTTTSQTFYLGQYANEDWAIAIAEGTAGYKYYGCNTTSGDCIKLEQGTQTCGGDVCTFAWTNGNLVYQAEISEMSKQVTVLQGEKVIAKTGELQAFYPSDDDIPAGREEVTGISETQLKTMADQIYQAVYQQDWQAIAALSTDTVRVNYADEERATEVPNDELAAVLNKADLSQWETRIMTHSLDNLLLNQYGAMFGGGSIWMGEMIDAPNPQIYSINIW